MYVVTLQVSRRSEALHDRVVINCQFSMSSFSTSERKRRPKGDRWVVTATWVLGKGMYYVHGDVFEVLNEGAKPTG